MRVEFDLISGDISVLEAGERGDRELFVQCSLEDDYVLEASFAVRGLANLELISSVNLEKTEENCYFGAIPQDFFVCDGKCIISIQAKKIVADEEIFGDIRFGSLEFSPPDKPAPDERANIKLSRLKPSEIRELTPDEASILYYCDAKGDFWRMKNSGGEVEKTNLTHILDKKVDSGDMVYFLIGKADVNYVNLHFERLDNELAKCATVSQLNQKADKSELADLVEQIAAKASQLDLSLLALSVDNKASKDELSELSSHTKGTLIYDAHSMYSSENLGLTGGIANGVTTALNLAAFKELDIYWRFDNMPYYRAKTSLTLLNGSYENQTTDVRTKPSAATSAAIDFHIALFKTNSIKTTFTPTFHIAPQNSSGLTVDSTAVVTKIVGRK